MTTNELIERLQQLGIRVRIRLEAPPGVLTEEIKREVRRRKQPLVALLAERDPACPSCRWPIPRHWKPPRCLACGWRSPAGEGEVES